MRSNSRLSNLGKEEHGEEYNKLKAHVDTVDKHLKQIYHAWIQVLDSSTITPNTKSFSEVLQRMKERISDYQEVGQRIKSGGEDLKGDSYHAKKIVKVGVAMKLIGQAENDLAVNITKEYLAPMVRFSEESMKNLRNEITILDTCFAELVATKNKFSKALEASKKVKSQTHDGAETTVDYVEQVKETEALYTTQKEKVINLMRLLLSDSPIQLDSYKTVARLYGDYHQRAIRYIMDAKKQIDDLNKKAEQNMEL